jgi:antitoxin CptB
MSPRDPQRERLRWRCRRGMLELDLVLSAFVERELETLGPQQLETLRVLLERPDPELLDYVMGQQEPARADERELIGLMRAVNVHLASQCNVTPGHSPEGRGEIRGASGEMPFAQH